MILTMWDVLLRLHATLVVLESSGKYDEATALMRAVAHSCLAAEVEALQSEQSGPQGALVPVRDSP